MVALPLIISLIYAVIHVDRIVDQNQQSLVQAVEATRGSLMLTEHLKAMERSALQFQILEDDSSFQLYKITHQTFLGTVADLSKLQMGETQQQQLKSLVEKEQTLFKDFQAAIGNNTMEVNAATAFAALSDLSQSILSENRRLIDREIEQMQLKAEVTQRNLVWQAMAIIPITIILMLGFTILIARPIRQIDQSIRRLGDGAFSSEISISGPKDLEYLGKRLDWLRTRLTELEQQKSQFLRHVSHELKTPLTAMRAGVELLIDEVSGGLNREQQKVVRILNEKNIQLQKMIEDLLNFSVVLERHSALSLEKIGLNHVVKNVATDHHLGMRAKGIHLELALEDQTIFGDEGKLVVVIDNLVSNAVKFTPQNGKIKIILNKKGNKVVLDVIDSGPGIDPEEKTRIFDPFYQGRHSIEKNVEGTGIGLSLVKEYVSAHHGMIEIVDRQDIGGHFRVTLPIQSFPEKA